MAESKTKIIVTRITETFAKVIDRYLEIDTHVSCSDFFWDAIREKIRRDAPQLLKDIFEGLNNE